MSEQIVPRSSRRPPAEKYQRPRQFISWGALLFGLIIGLGGGLAYAWLVNPVVEFDTEPRQLRERDKQHYIVAIMLGYTYDGRLDRAVNRLLELRLPGDPIQAVADVACDLATTGYVENNSGLYAVRAMMTFYQLQQKSGCADNLIAMGDLQPTTVVNVVVPTATLVPPPTKTPTPVGPDMPTATPLRVVVPTSVPQSGFVLVNISTYCDSALSGLIEVHVQDRNGNGLPGQRIRVRWDTGNNTFYTGLKPERGEGYADFQMEANTGYVVEMPGQSDPINEPLTAVSCTTNSGDRAITSYRVVFRPA